MKVVKSFSELMNVLGIKPGDSVNIMTPQFNREYEIEINFIPHDKNELFSLIETAPKKILQKMGVGVWATHKTDIEDDGETYLKSGEIHYLFPGEWYDHIPSGFEIVDISGKKEKFIHGKTDDDIRFGCLPYGFIRSF